MSGMRMKKVQLKKEIEMKEQQILDLEWKFRALSKKYIELVYEINLPKDNYQTYREVNIETSSSWMCYSCRQPPIVSKAAAAPCGHIFCWKCLNDLKKGTCKCPKCKTPLMRVENDL